MGLNFKPLYKGGSLPPASNIQPKKIQPLTPQNREFLLQIGLLPKNEHGHVRYWG
jgi:hypothetical protein